MRYIISDLKLGTCSLLICAMRLFPDRVRAFTQPDKLVHTDFRVYGHGRGEKREENHMEEDTMNRREERRKGNYSYLKDTLHMLMEKKKN